MDISVVVVNWNTKDLLLDCLESVERNIADRETEIIVVDNASSDGSADAVAERFPNVKLIRCDENLGFGRGSNVGINASCGRFVALVNSDVVILDHCLDRICDFMEEQTNVGVAGPKLLWPNLELQWSCRRLPSLWTLFCGAIGLPRIFPNSRLFGTEHMTYFPHDRTLTVDALVGALLVIRREVIEQVGIFDEDYFMYCEEVDLCKRITDGGWSVTFFPGAESIHVARASSSKEPGRFMLEAIKSQFRFWTKHFGPVRASLLTWIVSLHYSIRAVGHAAQYAVRPSQRADAMKRMKAEIAAVRFAHGLRRRGLGDA